MNGRVPGSNPYAFGGVEHRFLGHIASARELEAHRLADLAKVPPEHWSKSDVRFVIRSRPYHDSRDPTRETWQQRVRAFFAAKQVREAEDDVAGAAAEEPACGGTAHVRAYTRTGPSGRPVQVSAHQRAVPCD
jgi:hypothetical protein